MISFFSVFFLFAQNTEHLNCYTIVVGKNASSDGSVLIGHNEDDTGDMLINWFKIPKRKFKTGDSLTLYNGKKIKQASEALSVIRFQVTGEQFGDTYLNENSVIICSNACKSKEDTAKGSIAYDFRRIIAEQAKNAQDAVNIAGKLIEEFGYESSGRTYTIADKNEAWMLSVVKGKRWVAQRIPDDQAAIIPNYFTIQEVNLNDTFNFCSSDDLITYAQSRMWYDTLKIFNFREVYGDAENNGSAVNIYRHISGINKLSKQKYTDNDNLPFSFYPEKPVSVDVIKTILSDHFEGTVYNDSGSDVNPHNNKIRPICDKSTQYSLIAQLRSELPLEIGSLIWISPYNSCLFPYIPIYWNIYNTPDNFRLDNYNDAEQIHFNSEKNSLSGYPNHIYGLFKSYVNYIEADYVNRSRDAVNFKLKIEDELNRNQKKLENSVLKIYYSYPDDTKKILTQYFNQYNQRLSEHIKHTLKQNK